MLKQALIATAVLAASGVALANGGSFAPAPAPEHTCVFYVGAAVSRDTAQFDVDSANLINVTVPSVLGLPAFTASNLYTNDYDLGGQGIDGQLFAGVNMTFQDRYTLAAEVFGSISSLKSNFDVNDVFTTSFPGINAAFSSSGRIKLQNTFGVALLPGVMISPSTDVYLRVGYVNSDIDINDSGVIFPSSIVSNIGIIPPFGTGVLNGFPINEDKRESGIQLGLGASTMVTNNVGLRLEYTWERYGSTTFNQGPSTIFQSAPGTPLVGAGVNVTAAGAIKVRAESVDTVNFGVFYAFNS